MLGNYRLKVSVRSKTTSFPVRSERSVDEAGPGMQTCPCLCLTRACKPEYLQPSLVSEKWLHVHDNFFAAGYAPFEHSAGHEGHFAPEGGKRV